MASRSRPFRVGLTVVVLAAGVAVATSLWLTRSKPSSGGASFSAAAPPGVKDSRRADSPRSDPVADRSPDIRPACEGTGYGTQYSDGSSSSKPEVTAPSVTARHRNEAGSYEFLTSPTWDLREQGPLSRLVGPGRDFVVSIGPGPTEGLPRAYDEFVELVHKTYGNVRLDKIDAGCAGGDLSVLLEGKGTNSAAAPFEFLAVIIERSSGGTVGAFGAWSPKTPQVRPQVLEVMQSFHALPARS
jgi:hypothetical protein